MGMFFIFFMAFVFWLLLRSLVALQEWQRRTMWVAVVALAVIPNMSQHLYASELTTNVIWPLAAGVMASEVFWQRFSRKLPFLRSFEEQPPPPPVKKKRRKKKPPTL